MSYRCYFCKKTQEPNVPAVMVVMETRKKEYPVRHKKDKVIDKGGAGFETVREVISCVECSKER